MSIDLSVKLGGEGELIEQISEAYVRLRMHGRLFKYVRVNEADLSRAVDALQSIHGPMGVPEGHPAGSFVIGTPGRKLVVEPSEGVQPGDANFGPWILRVRE